MDTQTLTLITMVLAIAATAVGWLAWEWSRKQRPSAKLAADGVQEVTILVRNGYHPNTVRVRAGRPVRLVFQRAEDNPCSSRVYLAEPPLSRHLPPYAATAIGFTPTLVGNYLFTCEEGRHRGRLIVEPPNRPGFLAGSITPAEREPSAGAAPAPAKAVDVASHRADRIAGFPSTTRVA